MIAATYEKTRRYEVVKGTKYASVVVRVEADDRVRAEQAARSIALAAFVEKFGPIEWDSTELVFVHTTLDVVCEIRVQPWNS